MSSVGGYVIDRPIARGRSGTVYRATADDGSVVALKVYERRTEAAREAACLARLDHTGLASLLDAELHGSETAWLALRWIPGTTLRQRLASVGPLTVERALGITEQIASALEALHDAGFTHSDLSPSNILIDSQDHVTLVDFASAHRTDTPRSIAEETAGLEIETTPQYTAPEVASGYAPTERSDVYALAIVTYEALTGRSPYPEVATPIAMLGHHASTAPDPPSEHRPDLPPKVERALLAALEKDPARRTASPLAFSQHLRHDVPAPVQSASAGPRRPRTKLALLAAVGLAALLALVMFVRISGDRATDAAAAAVLEADAAAGSASSLTCNLITSPGFESTQLPASFYGPDPTNTVAQAAGGGVSDSTALRIGANGAYGLFAEIVPLPGSQELVLSAHLRIQGKPDATTMYVDYLDADYRELTSERDNALSRSSMGTAAGQRVEIRSTPPEGAAFAVPSFFKDATGGSLLVDEVVFGAATTCLAQS